MTLTALYLIFASSTDVFDHLQLWLSECILVKHFHEALHWTVNDLIDSERQILFCHLLHAAPASLEEVSTAASRSACTTLTWHILLHLSRLLSRLYWI